jgi:hypothetical protein
MSVKYTLEWREMVDRLMAKVEIRLGCDRAYRRRISAMVAALLAEDAAASIDGRRSQRARTVRS